MEISSVTLLGAWICVPIVWLGMILVSLTRIVYEDRKYKVHIYKKYEEIPDKYDFNNNLGALDAGVCLIGPVIVFGVRAYYCESATGPCDSGWPYFMLSIAVAVGIPPVWVIFRNILAMVKVLIRTRKER